MRTRLGFNANWESYLQAELLLGQCDRRIHNLLAHSLPFTNFPTIFSVSVYRDILIPGQLLNQAIISFRDEARKIRQRVGTSRNIYVCILFSFIFISANAVTTNIAPATTENAVSE